MNIGTLTNDEFVNMLTTDPVINNELVAELLKRYKLALDKLGDDVIYLAREERFDDHRV